MGISPFRKKHARLVAFKIKVLSKALTIRYEYWRTMGAF
jgi:hypothetical protein